MINFSSSQYLSRELYLHPRRHRSLMISHLLSLDEESRRNRFCGLVSDEAIRNYIDRLDSSRDYMFGIYSLPSVKEDPRILALAHLGREDPNPASQHYELALSVANSHRRRGLGSMLLEDILFNKAPILGVKSISCQCLYTNRKVQELFKRKGVTLEIDIRDNSSEGKIQIPEPTMMARCIESTTQLLALQQEISRTGFATLRLIYS